MPTGNLPKKAKEVYLKAEASAKETCEKGDRYEECIARKAWAAVKRGWKQEGDKWVPKTTAEFSFHIYRASLNKKDQTMRWFATASDTEEDSYQDNMTQELYDDFLSRIMSEEPPPERHRSDYWAGGMPYLSVSHYLDLNGDGVPGDVDEVYVDGVKLKAKGTFHNTPLGLRCFEAVCKDLYSEEKSDQSPVRISIAFIDWGHRHKSNGYEFIRESLDEICPECIKELLTGESEGKEFLRGHLIHLALTRVPVNERTSMEVRSMVTQLEDAESIVGEDEAEKLEELAKEVGKADLVIKSETEEEEEPVVEQAKAENKKDEKEEEEEDEEEEEMKSHVLDEVFSTFRASYDEVTAKGLASDQALMELQEPFELFAEGIKSTVQTPEDRKRAEERSLVDEIKSIIAPLQQSVQTLTQKVSILEQQSQAVTHQNPEQTDQTVRRSYQIQNPIDLLDPAPSDGKPMSTSEIARRSVLGR